jgi:O-antigen/teichoic acid export membrane protein
VGLQRNDIPAAIAVVGNLLLIVGLTVAVIETRSLVVAGLAYLASVTAMCGVQYATFRYAAPWCKPDFLRISTGAWRELATYCVSLAGWSFGMLIVSGLDTSIVGFFDFANVAAYGVATTAVLMLIGLVPALLGPVTQIFARLHARNEVVRLAQLLDLSSFSFTTFLIVGGCWLAVVGRFAFPLWIGHRLGTSALPFFYVLVVANVLRNTCAPYACYLVAAAEQGRTYVAPITETVSNFVSSILLALWFGAIGVALGTLIGAILSVGATAIYTIPKTGPTGLRPTDFLRAAVFKPMLICAPLIAATVYVASGKAGIAISAIALVIATIWPAYRLVHVWRSADRAPPVASPLNAATES